MDHSHVLFILTEQWPAWAFGYRGADIPTPNIDRLAATGTVFDNAFTSCPLCTPARGSLLTARWPHQTGVLDNYSGGYSLQESLPLLGAPQRQPTWPDRAMGTYSRYNGYCFEVRAIRDERFKYVWNPQDRDELYDLCEDPYEMRNLADRESVGDREQSLRRQLLDWLEQTGDDLPYRLDELLPAGTVVATGEAGP